MSGSYTIPINGLKEGTHIVDFEIGKEFFEQYEESEIKEGSLIAIVTLEKRSTHMDLMIRISGEVKVNCDRCLEEYSQRVDCENRLLVKFGRVIEDTDPDILSLAADEYELDLQHHFYEYIYLALPIRRIHPDDNKGNSSCNPAMLKKLEELIIEEEAEIDPRWDELKKLMNDN